jgi:hypothetical protein
MMASGAEHARSPFPSLHIDLLDVPYPRMGLDVRQVVGV